MRSKLGYFIFVLIVVALSGCASLTNPVPVAGHQQTAQQKSAQQHQSGIQTFFSEVI